MADEPLIHDNIPSADNGVTLQGLTDELKVKGTFSTNLSGIEECNGQYDRWMASLQRFMREIPDMESDAEKTAAIEKILTFCDQIAKTKITYLSDESGGNSAPVSKVYTPDKNRVKMLKDASADFVTMFNNLPSRLALFEKLKTEQDDANYAVNKLKANVRDTRDSFRSAEKSFWAENPEVLNRKREVKLKSYIILAVSAILAIICVAVAAMKELIYLYAIAVLLIALALFLRKKSVDRSVRKIKEECFPQSLKDLETLLKSYQTELDAALQRQNKAQEAMADFEAERK